MRDAFGRQIDYLRISVTDRCNFRCHYCMPQNHKFLPRDALLEYREITDIASRFMAHGIKKIRLTGGEPLLRREIESLITALGNFVHSGQLDELTLTTNGSRLANFAPVLAEAGVRRINVSLDSLDPSRFRAITRGGELQAVMDGIAAAANAGMSIRINMVALRGQNEADLLPVAEFCADNGHDLAIIETMPLGRGVAGRQDCYIPLEEFTIPLRETQDFRAIAHRSAGPARYWRLEPLGLRLGLITPMSENFCDDCNRLRMTTDGKIFMCLGSNMHVDFKQAIREGGVSAVDSLIEKALRLKPLRHDFETQMAKPGYRLDRHMNATGG